MEHGLEILRKALHLEGLSFLVFYSTMILFRTILNRDIWFDPLGDVMGKWGLHNADGTLCTEPIENFMLYAFCGAFALGV